ncbi:hypothetical protein [Halorientalis marina]|uniref:hypothetical protein n=1 Tax=Halorientalis marina TaxID=2931976 RepID=UPI001FF4CC88|nr:hypothetical protein [Halorientalis marina]
MRTWIAGRTQSQARALAASIGSISAVLVALALTRLSTLLVTVTTWGIYAQTTTSSGGAGGNTQQVQDAVCGSGLGPLLGIILVLIALYLLIKAVLRGMMAFDKLGSSQTEEVQRGQRLLRGSVMTVVGAMVPGIFLAMMEVIGYPTVSCISQNVDILLIVPL